MDEHSKNIPDILSAHKVFRDYILSLRDDSGIPDVRSFDPDRMGETNREIALLEYISASNLNVRYYGETLCQRMGFNPTGLNLLDFVASHARDFTASMLGILIEKRVGSKADFSNEYDNGHAGNVKTVFMPLHNPDTGQWFVAGLFLETQPPNLGQEDTGEVLNQTIYHAEYFDIGFGLLPAPPDLGQRIIDR